MLQSKMAPYTVSRSEEEVGEKVDRCVTDAIVKAGAGAALGVVFSFVLFKRKAWPVAFGTGTGLGMAISNCQTEFRRIFPEPQSYVVKAEEVEESSKS